MTAPYGFLQGFIEFQVRRGIGVWAQMLQGWFECRGPCGPEFSTHSCG